MSESDHDEYQRSFPSSIPIRSPSPDLKNKNRILKTISPTLQIKKQMTPHNRDSRGYNTLPNDENEDHTYSIHDFDKSYEATDIKRLKQKLEQKDRIILQLSSQSKQKSISNSKSKDIKQSQIFQDMKSKIAEKDKIINDLKKVITTLSQKSHISQSRSQSERMKILEIENERLGQIIRKLNKKDKEQKSMKQSKMYSEFTLLENKIEELTSHNKDLENKIIKNKKDKDIEVNLLKQENQELKSKIHELILFEQKNLSLENQNERLLKLLTDKKSSLPQITISQQNQIFKLQTEIKSLKEKNAPEKMTLMKIREQYNESLRLFKEQVEQMVDLEFQKMKDIINGLTNKLARIEHKIPQIDELQKSVMESPVKFAQLSKSYIQETADLNSEIKRQRGQKRLIEQKFQQLQRTYDNLVRIREQDMAKSQQKMRQSMIDIQQLKNQAELDRKKHHQQLDIIKTSHENEIIRLKNKHRQQVDDFKSTTKYQINEVVNNYSKQINVLKTTISTFENEISRLQQDSLNKQVQYKRNTQIVQQRLRNQCQEVTRLANIIQQKQNIIKSLKQNKLQIEELGEVRKRSQTQLQLRYSQTQSKYSELLSNHADISTKYTQLLNKFNNIAEQLQKNRRSNIQFESSANNNLSQQNLTIRELNNQILSLQNQLHNSKQDNLKIKYELAELGNYTKNVQYQVQKYQTQLKNTQNQKQNIQNQILSLKSKIVNHSIKSKITYQNIHKIQSETLNTNQQFIRMIEDISDRIIRLEKQNESLKGIIRTNQIIVENLKKDVLREQIDIQTYKYQLEECKNNIEGLTRRLEIKERELMELKNLLSQKTMHQSTIVEEEISVPINLDDVERLKKEYQRIIESLTTQIIAIKRIVVETTETEYQTNY